MVELFQKLAGFLKGRRPLSCLNSRNRACKPGSVGVSGDFADLELSSILSVRYRTALCHLTKHMPCRHRHFCLFTQVLHRIGFTLTHKVTSVPVSSYLAFPSLPSLAGGRFISVALSLRLPSADVIRYPALRCPDFPHGNTLRRHTARQHSSVPPYIITHYFSFVKYNFSKSSLFLYLLPQISYPRGKLQIIYYKICEKYSKMLTTVHTGEII